jgi:hypothetical protein
MSLLDDVSIVVTPNGYKAGTLFGVIPVPSEGAEEVVNGDFATDSDWNTGTGWSISNGELVGNNATSITYQGISAQPNTFYKVTFTVSNYVSGNVLFQFNGGSNSGTPRTSVGTYTEYIATDASVNGNFSITRTQNFTGSIDNVSVKEYTAADMDVTRATAATRVDEDGLISDVLSNVPRIDYTGCPHILAEPQRTNLVTYSEDYDDASWTKSQSTITVDATTSPDGTVNADKLTEAALSGSHTITQGNITVTSGAEVSYSVFAKKGERDFTLLWFAQVSTGYSFDLNNGAIGSKIGGGTITPKIEDYGNGWYKCTVTGTAPSTLANIIIYTMTDTTTYSYAGDGTSGIYIWGAQLEEGSYATSYIPNFGTSAGVTRAQDIFTRDGIGSLINSTSGSFFLDMAALNDIPGAQISISLSGDTSSDRILIYSGSGGGSWLVQFRKDSGNLVVLQHTATVTNQSKVAVSWEAGRYVMYVDGTKVTNYTTGSETEATTFDAGDLKNLQFSPNHNSSSNYFNGKVRQLQVYTTALSPTQLAALTT